jgi:hypothetical protein
MISPDLDRLWRKPSESSTKLTSFLVKVNSRSRPDTLTKKRLINLIVNSSPIYLVINGTNKQIRSASRNRK